MAEMLTDDTLIERFDRQTGKFEGNLRLDDLLDVATAYDDSPMDVLDDLANGMPYITDYFVYSPQSNRQPQTDK